MLNLNVAYAQKDEAKSLGAKWNNEKRTWYVPDGVNPALFTQWLPCANPPVSTKSTVKREPLFVEMIPQSAWFSNLRSELNPEEWKEVSRKTARQANNHCEICGGQGSAHPVECHERWNFDMQSHIQTLIRTIALCPACHEATHFGLARIKGRDREAEQQLRKVNNWDEVQVIRHIELAGIAWEQRSAIDWTLDARWLLTFLPLSEKSANIIIEHAAGLLERKIEPWQQDIIRSS